MDDMVFLVPFDGSPLAEAALRRANEFARHADAEVVALSVVPEEASYAEERGWIDAHDHTDSEAVAQQLEARVAELAPDATFRWEVPKDTSSIASTTTDVARCIRQVAYELDVEIVFVGSENAGRVAPPVNSVGSPVSEDPAYDVFIVRHAE